MANITGVNPPVLNDEDYVDKIYDSFTAIDNHDHTTGKGKPITASAITDGVITEAKLATVLANASKFLVRDAAGIVVSNTKAVPAGVVVGDTDTQTLTNKTLGVTSTITLKDTLFTLQDDGDLTKQFKVQLSSITTGNTRTWTVPDADGTFVGTTNTQTLTNKTLTTPVIDIASFTDQGSTPATPASGTSKIYTKTDGKAYKLTSAGVEQQLGAGASGGTINYLSANPDAETATTGWATYADGATATPVDGTGGSPTTTFTRSTSSPLRDTASFLITQTAANLQGEGASFAFTVPAADAAKVVSISFDYSVATGTYVTGDYTVYIYDVTNSTLIQPAGYQIQAMGSTLANKHIATFQTSSTGTSYRFIIHRAVTTATACTLKFDNFVVGPQTVLYGAPVTDWTSYTPTGTWTGTTTYTGKWRRVGDSMELEANIALSGAPTGGTLTDIFLPTGYTIDTTKMTVAGGATRSYGPTYLKSAGSTYVGITEYNSTTSVRPALINASATYGTDANINATTPGIFASGDYVFVRAVFPILGWSSTVQMSSDTDTRVVAARYSTTQTTALTGSDAIINFDTLVHDTHSAVTTGASWKYTVTVPGYYHVKGQLQTSSTAASTITNQYFLILYKNGSSNATVASTAGTTTACRKYTSVDATVLCVAGDTLDLRMSASNSGDSHTLAAGSYFDIYRLSGPSAIAAVESVLARYYNSAGTTVVDNADRFMDFPSASYDTHNAVLGAGSGFNATYSSTWRYIAPVAGYFEVDVWWIVTTSSTASTRYRIYVAVDGTEDSAIVEDTNPDTATTKDYAYSGRTIVKVLAGQAISIGVLKIGATMALANNSTARNSRITISKVNR